MDIYKYLGEPEGSCRPKRITLLDIYSVRFKAEELLQCGYTAKQVRQASLKMGPIDEEKTKAIASCMTQLLKMDKEI